MLEQQIECPKCETVIDVNAVLSEKIEKQVQERFQGKESAQKKKLTDAVRILKKKELSIKSKEDNFEQKLQEMLQSKLKIKEETLRVSLKLQLQQESSEQISLMNKELEEKSEKIKLLHRSQAEIERLKRENVEMEERIMFESQQKLNQELENSKIAIEKRFREANELKLKEKEMQLDDLHQKLEEARRKAEQGSQQSQGEVQELAIEEWLTSHFPFDSIEEIKKGMRGADCLQNIHTRDILNCGTIYYESKRTKEFQKSWIEKFKSDMREKGADVGVLVTEVLPKELERFGMIEGIWICTYEEFKALCFVLRENIVKIAHSLQSQENKSDKMSLLYAYLSSNEFRMQIEAIVEGFTQMQSDLDGEKRALGRIWKQREKQIQKVLDNTVGMYGSVRGIAGSSIKSIPALELDNK